MKYFDTHCHLTSDYFNEEQIKELINQAKESGVDKILIPGTSIKDSKEIIDSKYGANIYKAVGIHPSDVSDNCSQELKKFDLTKVVAIGEIGLDFHWEDNPPKEIQIKEFKAQLDIALENNLPVLIHSRDADKEMLEVLSESKYKDLIKVMHSFGSNWEQAQKLLDLGCYLSFSGVVTFKNAKNVQEVALKAPLNRVLIETDTPYLTPAPNRGKQNNPANVKHVGDFIAELRAEKNVLEQIYKNSCEVFKC